MSDPRKVLQYDLDGNLVGVYSSIREAERKYRCTHISSVCRGERNFEKGFVWRYAPDPPEKAPSRQRKKK